MNQINYASFDASKRLVDAGIVLETEKVHFQIGDVWFLRDLLCAGSNLIPCKICIPAPSMAEVWRELPEEIDGSFLEVWKHHTKKESGASYTIPADGYDDSPEEVISFTNINPTDALIDLLIWVRKEATNGKS